MLCPQPRLDPGGLELGSVLKSLDATSDSSGGWERLKSLGDSQGIPEARKGGKPGRLNDFGEKS